MSPLFKLAAGSLLITAVVFWIIKTLLEIIVNLIQVIG